MISYYIRGKTIWLNYYVDGERIQKSTKLKDNPKNIKIVTNQIIPQVTMQIATGEIYKKKPKTFRYYGDIFLEEKKVRLKAYEQREAYFNRVIEYFGDTDIDKISRLEIKQYLNSLKMKSKSKGAYKSAIKEIFELAVDDEAIINNPALNIKLSEDLKEDIEYFTKQEVKILLNNARGVIRVYLYIAFNTGMRPEEILGLQYNDFKPNYIDIKRVRTKGRIDTPKTKSSVRKLPYPKFLLNEVDSIVVKDNTSFLFGDIDDAGKLRSQWSRVLKDSGFKHKKLYCTRHTFATLMLQEKVVSINELAGLLGHSSPKVTLAHYASIIDPMLINLGKDFSLYCDNTVTE